MNEGRWEERNEGRESKKQGGKDGSGNGGKQQCSILARRKEDIKKDGEKGGYEV